MCEYNKPLYLKNYLKNNENTVEKQCRCIFFNTFCNFNILYMVILCIVILMFLILERNLDSKECSSFQLK